MKTFFSLVLSFLCVLTISQAQSLDSAPPADFNVDFLNIECMEMLFETSADEESALESAMALMRFGCKCKGDINRDGNVNLLDVDPFTTAVRLGLNDPCADMNHDGKVNLLDVAPFVEELQSGGCGS